MPYRFWLMQRLHDAVESFDDGGRAAVRSTFAAAGTRCVARPPHRPAGRTGRQPRGVGAYGVTGMADQPKAVDGRRARRDRNRNAVLDVVLEMFAEEALMPSIEEASRAVGPVAPLGLPLLRRPRRAARGRDRTEPRAEPSPRPHSCHRAGQFREPARHVHRDADRHLRARRSDLPSHDPHRVATHPASRVARRYPQVVAPTARAPVRNRTRATCQSRTEVGARCSRHPDPTRRDRLPPRSVSVLRRRDGRYRQDRVDGRADEPELIA